MGVTRIELTTATRDRLKAHMRGGESYDDFLNTFMDYMEGLGFVLPWPRRSLALWRQMRAQGVKGFGEMADVEQMP